MHEQDEITKEIWAHQQHYVPQINEIALESKHFVCDEDKADDDLRQLFMSLVGALAWLILTMPAICIYVAFLQRHAKEPMIGHIRQANRLLQWIRKNLSRLGLRYKPLRGPLRLITLSDSAFKAQDTQGLVMRGCMIMLAEAGNLKSGDALAATTPHSTKVWHTGDQIQCHVLDWYSRKHSRVVRSTYAAELLSLLDATNQGSIIQLCLHELVRGTQPSRQLTQLKSPDMAIPMDVGGDARAVYDSVTAVQLKTPDDKHLLLHARAMREFLESGPVDRLYWFDTEDMLPDGLTKGSIDREALISVCEQGVWQICHAEPVSTSLVRDKDDEDETSLGMTYLIAGRHDEES